MKNIEFSNCMQVIGIIGILPNRVCGRARSNKLMDLQFSNNLPSETEGAESEDGDISTDLQFSNNFPSETTKLGCVHFEAEMLQWFNHRSFSNFYMSIFFSVGRNFPKLVVGIVPGLEDFDGFVEISINGYENRENRVKVSIRCKSDDTCYSIKKWGVHVECTCPPQEDDAVDYGYSIKGWRSKKQRTR